MSAHQDPPSSILPTPEAAIQPQLPPHPDPPSVRFATLPNHHSMDRTEEEHRSQSVAEPDQAHAEPLKHITVEEHQSQSMAEPNHSPAGPPPKCTANDHASYMPDNECRIQGNRPSGPKRGVDLEGGGDIKLYLVKKRKTIRYGCTEVSILFNSRVF